MSDLQLTREQAEALVKAAEQNDGHCDKCHRVINIYRYRANAVMAKILRKMAAATSDGGRAIDVEQLDLKHSERTQLTKMRFHGLVAKVKENGTHVPRHWTITHKGWNWLKGEPIQEKVLVFNNAVLGHEGELITIKRVLNEAEFESQPISTEEAGVYGAAREGFKGLIVEAVFKGRYSNQFKTGETYTLKLRRLQVGKAVQIVDPVEVDYKDIAAFAAQWRVIKKETAQ